MTRNLTQEDLAELKINIAKFRADGGRYFELFDKHIPTGLAGDSKVLLYKIGNLTTIVKIIEKNPAAAYCIYDRECVCAGIRALKPSANVQVVFTDSSDKYDIFENREMKFDLIIMNPPYSRNLHLKILAEAIQHLKDEKSVCVNLSPIRWLQDPLAKYKKTSDLKTFNKNVVKHIKNIDLLNVKDINNLFEIKNFTDLGVYACITKECDFNEDLLVDEYLGNRKTIFQKIWKFCCISNMADKVVYDLHGISVKFNCHFGGHNNPYTLISSNHQHPYIDGKTIDGKTYADCAFKKKDVDENKQEQSTVKFNSIKEAENFIKTVNTGFYMFVNSLTKRDVHVMLIGLPWLGDAVNPRTGLKGYLGPWTDEDFYEFFEITAEERRIIEDTTAKYR